MGRGFSSAIAATDRLVDFKAISNVDVVHKATYEKEK